MPDYKHQSNYWEIERPFAEPEFMLKQSSDFDLFPELESPFVDGFDLTTHQNSLATELKRDESEIETFINITGQIIQNSLRLATGKKINHLPDDVVLEAIDMMK